MTETELSFVKADVGVWCKKCGRCLGNISSGRKGGIDVGICPDCRLDIEDASYEHGFTEGYNKAMSERGEI